MVDFIKEQAQSLEKTVTAAADHLRELVLGSDSEDELQACDLPFSHKRYRYNHDTIVAPWPMLDTKEDGFPKEKNPSAGWYLKVVNVVLKIAANRLAWREGGRAVKEEENEKFELDLSHLGLGKTTATACTVADDLLEGFGESKTSDAETDKSMAELLKIARKLLKQGIRDPLDILATVEQGIKNSPQGRPKSIDDYRSLFVTEPPPEISDNYEDDKIFANLRVAGYNPVVIKQIGRLPGNFPVTDTMLGDATAKGDTLTVAGEEGRLFLADYSTLNDYEMGNYPTGPKYLLAPMVLLALPPGRDTRKLVPVAIQCGQDPKEFPVHTPAEGTLWSRAKATVEQADSNYHELVSHLAGCHLLMEPFAIATHNELVEEDHPIGHLLTPHFEGTLFINDSAISTLLGAEGQVSKLLAAKIEESHKVSVNALLKENYFNGHMLPVLLEERGVMSPDLHYPYRDDALDLWRAIQVWVRGYVGVFYKDDAAVVNDAALQAWAKQLVAEDGGRLGGFGEKDANGVFVSGRMTTVEYLVDVLTMVIFTASASHATFNFAQKKMMTFVPAVPLAIYRAMPITERQASVMPALDQLPPLEMARLQMEFLMLLGGVYHTRLGQYKENWPQNEAVRSALATFQEQLKNVSSTIADRNKSRSPAYTLLLPKNIPQSINI